MNGVQQYVTYCKLNVSLPIRCVTDCNRDAYFILRKLVVIPLLEFPDNRRRLCARVCVAYMHVRVCVCVQGFCVPAISLVGGNSSLLGWFCFKWCEAWLQAAGFPVVWRCGRINYRDIEWQASKWSLMSTRQWRRCGAAQDDTSNSLGLKINWKGHGFCSVSRRPHLQQNPKSHFTCY